MKRLKMLLKSFQIFVIFTALSPAIMLAAFVFVLILPFCAALGMYEDDEEAGVICFKSPIFWSKS